MQISTYLHAESLLETGSGLKTHFLKSLIERSFTQEAAPGPEGAGSGDGRPQSWAVTKGPPGVAA